jgi:hypothetical protein
MVWSESGPRWFGVKFWKTWAVNGEVGHVEEAVYVVRAENVADAEAAGWSAARRDDNDFRNEDGELVQVRVAKLDYVWDMKASRLRSGTEVLGQVFEVDEDGTINLELPTDA